MNMLKTQSTALAVAVFVLVSLAHTAGADGSSWQTKNLFKPGPTQLQSEKRGRVTIYHGLKDTDVHRAMDEQFERIDNMMFTGTIVTDGTGQPLRDPDTGAVVVEDDGCD